MLSSSEELILVHIWIRLWISIISRPRRGNLKTWTIVPVISSREAKSRIGPWLVCLILHHLHECLQNLRLLVRWSRWHVSVEATKLVSVESLPLVRVLSLDMIEQLTEQVLVPELLVPSVVAELVLWSVSEGVVAWRWKLLSVSLTWVQTSKRLSKLASYLLPVHLIATPRTKVLEIGIASIEDIFQCVQNRVSVHILLVWKVVACACACANNHLILWFFAAVSLKYFNWIFLVVVDLGLIFLWCLLDACPFCRVF